ncbi:A118-like holin Hol118 [Planomicrobium soli]|uniref:A118-like holin Hol118 n=1 Tax=Planomicrobium soli TaxID=1176648 RepID=A0A2P8H7B0_9BACL|nr:holin [Planomicrobium soli]PSL42118.1 A118-like holin Hol118 [Planomicrobium soli]
MAAVLIFASILVPIITALVEMIKKTVDLRVNFISVLAFLVGLIIGLAAFPFTDLDSINRLWAGGLAGLAATGLYEVVKQRENKPKGGDE